MRNVRKKIKELKKKALSLALSAAMLASSAAIPFSLKTEKASAARATSTSIDNLGWDLYDPESGESDVIRAHEEVPSGADVVYSVNDAVKKGNIPIFSTNGTNNQACMLRELNTNDEVYKWVTSDETTRDGLKGPKYVLGDNNNYKLVGCRIDPDAEYTMTWRNVPILETGTHKEFRDEAGNILKFDISFTVRGFLGRVDDDIINYDKDEDDDDRGPFIAFSQKSFGWNAKNGYRRYTMEVSLDSVSPGNSISLPNGQKLYGTFRISDIDQHQAVSITPGQQKRVISGTYGTNIKPVSKSNESDYKAYMRTWMPKPKDQNGNELPVDLNDAVYHFQGGNNDQDQTDPAVLDKFGLKLNLVFDENHRKFVFCFYSGNTSTSGYGNQEGIVFTGFDALMNADKGITIPKHVVPSPVTKKVNGEDSLTLDASSAGQAFEYTLSNTISADVARIVDDDTGDYDLTKYGFEDQLEGCLERTGDPAVTLGDDDVTGQFDINVTEGNKVTAYMKAANRKHIGSGTYVLHIPVKVKDGADLSAYVNRTATGCTQNKPGFAEIPNGCEVHFETTDSEQPYTVAYGHDETNPNIHDYVHVYWKPEALPAPVKTVNGKANETLGDANKDITYRVTQTIPANTYPYGHMDKFVITDKVDDQLVIDKANVKVVDADNNPLEGFDITYNGNTVSATAGGALTNNEGPLYGRGSAKTVTLVIPAHYYRIGDNGSYESHRIKDFGAYKLTDGTDAEAHIDNGETRVLTQNNAQVTNEWDAWSADEGWNKTQTTNKTNATAGIPKITAPTKTVTDADQNNDETPGTKNKLTNADEVWTYTIEQKIPAKAAAIYRYTGFKIEDQIDPCLTIGQDVTKGENKLDDITVTIGGQTMNRTDVKVEESGNKLTFTPGDDLLKGGSGNLFYGGNELKETSIRITIPVHIYAGPSEGGSDASNQAALEKIRQHGHIHTDGNGNEDYMTFTNKATTTVDDMLSTTPATFDTGTTTTRLDVPQLADPVKYVSDKDDYNWDHSVAKDGEVQYGKHNRISDASNQWYYTVEQDIPAHVAPLYYFKTFRYVDNVDKCLEYDPAHVKVFLYAKDADINGRGTDITSWFESVKDDNNILTVTAKDGQKGAKSGEEEGGLKSDALYGNKKGSKVVMVFPVHIKLAENPYDTSAMKEHGHLITDDKGHQVYDFKNADKDTLTETIIDNLVKVNNNMASDVTTKEDYRILGDGDGEEVETQVEVPMPQIKKKADRFEWEVGEDVKYTITVKNENPGSIMDKVTITDTDLPDCMQLDGSREDAIMVYASGATENFSAPGNAQAVPATRGLLEETEENAIVGKVEEKGSQTNPLNPWILSNDDESFLEDITGKCEVTYYNDKGDTGDGFKVLVPKQYRGEEIKITFLCKITEDFDNCKYKETCVNGSIVENTADVTATLMLNDEPQVSTEHIWVNTPHLSIQKLTGSYEYRDGEFVRVDDNQTNYKPGDSVHYTLLVKNSHPGTVARDPVVTDKVVTDGMVINKNDIEVNMIRLGADGKPRVKDGLVAETRLSEGTDYQLATYGQTYFEIYFTGRNLRHWGDSPFGKDVDEDIVNNGPYENGTTDDTKIPGLKATDEDHYFSERETSDGEKILYRDDKAFENGVVTNENSAWLTNKQYANTWDQYPVGYQTSNNDGTDTADVWKSKRTVNHPEEWEEADTAYIIEYNATLTRGITLEKAIRNDVYADSENSDLTSTHTTIHFEGADLAIDKESDKGFGGEYNVGSTGHYSIVVTNEQDQVEAKNIVIKDTLGKEEAKIVKDSIKVFFYEDRSKIKFDGDRQAHGGEDISGSVTLPAEANTDHEIYINTGKNLTTKQAIVVTYDIDFTNAALAGQNVPNTAMAKADNAYPELAETTPVVKISEDISTRKTSEPYTGTTVKQGETIQYVIDVTNTSQGDLTNILVRDFIPEHSTYVDGSAYVRESNDPVNVIEIDGKQAVAAVIPVLHKGVTRQLVYSVTVNEDATDDDIVLNVAEIYDTSDDEIAPGTKFEKGQPFNEDISNLFGTSPFVLTNQTVHPLAYWAVDDHLAHLIGNDITPTKTADKKEYYVGETIYYTVTLSNKTKDIPVEGLKLDDVMDSKSASIIEDSFKVVHFTDGKENVLNVTPQISEDKNGYHIDFGIDLKYGEHVTVTYRAKAVKAVESLTNNATFSDAKGKEYPVSADVKITDPVMLIEKTVDPAAPQALALDGKASYKVKVTQPTDRGAIENLTVEDKLEQAGLIEIEEGSIKVSWNGSPLEGAVITLNEAKDGYKVETGKTLTTKDTLEITYSGIPQRAAVDFCAAEENTDHDIDNTAYAWGTLDGEETEKVQSTAHTTVREYDTNLVVSKKSDKETYSVTTPAMQEKGNIEYAHYTVVVKNEKDGKAEKVVIADAFEKTGMTINKDSIKVYIVNKENHAGKGEAQYGADITDKVNIQKDIADNAYRIETGMDLELNDYFTVTYDVMFTDPALAGADIVNTVTATDDNGDETKANNKVKVKIPELIPEKSSDAPKYTVGESGTYTVVIEQKEEGVTAYNVVISDKISAPVEGFSIVDGSIRITDNAGTDITKDVNISSGTDYYVIETGKNLNYGEKFTVTYDVAFLSQNLDGVAVTNIASVKADNAPERTSENKVVIPDMTIWKDSEPASGTSVNTGDKITYKIHVENTSDADLENVLIKDAIPAGTEYVSGGTVREIDGTEYVTFVIDKLEAGKTAEESFEVKVTAKGPATVRNIALVKPGGDPENGWTEDPENPWIPTNETEHPVPEPVNGITAVKESTPVSGTQVKTPKVGEDGKYAVDDEGNIVFENDEIEYKITVKNTTDKTIENVAVRDMVPEYTEWTDGGEIMKIGEKDYVTFVIDKIEAGESAEVSFKVKVTADGTDGQKRIINTAEFKVSDDPEVSWEDGTWTPTNKVFHDIPNVVTVESFPTLAIEKHADKKEYKVGETGHYTVTVTETTEGRVAKNVVIEDALENEGAEIQAATVTLYDKDHNKLDAEIRMDGTKGYHIDTGRDLAYGEELVVEYDVLFKSDSLANQDVVNVAKAKSDNARAVTTNDVEVPPVEIEDGLYMRKLSDPVSGTTVKNGEQITYHIEVTADSEKDNVLIMDAVPDKTTYVDGSAKIVAKTAAADTKKEETKEDKGILSSIADGFKKLFGLASEDDKAEDTNGSDETVAASETTSTSEVTELGKGSLVTIGDKPYVAFAIDKVTSDKTYIASFTVTVNEDAEESDIIKNVALGKTAENEDPEDPSTWNPDNFKPTNETEHPLSSWVKDDETVKVTKDNGDTPDNPAGKEPGLSVTKASDKSSYKVGETGHYTVVTEETVEGQTATNVVLTDKLQTKGAEILPDTVKVSRTESAGEAKDVTGNVKVEASSTGYTITTGMNLAYGEKFTVTYDVLFKAETLNGKNVVNKAVSQADNAGPVETEHTVPIGETSEDKKPVLSIKKKSNKTSYNLGDTATYTIQITNTVEGTTVNNVQINDLFENKKVEIDKDSVVLKDQDGKEHKVKITNKADTYYGFNISTGLNLDGGKTMTVTYKAAFNDSSLNGKNIKNTATASADNAEKVTADNTVKIGKDKEENTTEKKSDKNTSNSKDSNSGGNNSNSGTVKTMDILMRIALVLLGMLAVAGLVYDRRRRRKGN